MRVGLLMRCYVDPMFPAVAMATLEVLDRQGGEVAVPAGQTCCAQALFNAGQWDAAHPPAEQHLADFENFEHVVCPSGSPRGRDPPFT
jgi:L-lactate dehydrogenase complex protein LldE